MKAPINATVDQYGRQARGCLPRDTALGAEGMPVYEQQEWTRIYSRSEWPEMIRKNGKGLRPLVSQIKNQGNEGSCASNATAQAAEIVLRQSMGKRAWIEFSPISIYRFVANGPGSGSTISSNLRRLTQNGMLPVRGSRSTEALKAMGLPTSHTLTSTGYYQDFPSGWTGTAEYFQGVEAFDVSSFAGIVSAVLDGFPVVYGRSGHAICATNIWYSGGKFGLEYANSWKPTWGDQGFGRDTENFVSGAIRSYGAWALRTFKYSNELLEWALAA